MTGRPIRVEKADSCTTSTLLLLKRSQKKIPQKNNRARGKQTNHEKKDDKEMERRYRKLFEACCFVATWPWQPGRPTFARQPRVSRCHGHGRAHTCTPRSVITRCADWMTGGALVSDTWNYCLTFGFKKQKRQSVIKKKKSYGCDLNALN